MSLAHKLARHVGHRFCVDLGPPEPAIFIAGTGRSGTTWVSELLDVGGRHRSMNEPFQVREVPQVAPLGRRGGQNLYVAPDDEDTAKIAVAKRILACGPWTNRWVNAFNERVVYRSRIIKKIRANLMLAWLARIAPMMPIVWIVRHPLAVAASWTQLEWLPGGGGDYPRDAMLARLSRPSKTDYRGRAARGEVATSGWHGAVTPTQKARARRLLAATGFGWYEDDLPPAAGVWQGEARACVGALAS
jgi:hypothetical protein